MHRANSIQACLEELRTGDPSASLLGLSAILILSRPPTTASPELLDGPGLWSLRAVVRAMAGLDMNGLLTTYCSTFLFIFG